MSSKPIFDKLLVANRGEIACRVMKTCKKMGIKTVAVHSTADAQSKFVRMADEAVCIGPPPSKESYLCIDKVIDACLKTKANAVHPGYGFLSENGDFSAALRKNNIVFVGPDAHSIEAMGDKINSKILAKEAGVHTIPGFLGEITSNEQLLKCCHEIGYPVMIKASGGGGGKGMKMATNDKEAIEYFHLCREEAIASFNNPRMLVEKFVSKPRHIELQVLADRHGNAIYLNERECSIQRRNQKVLEEAPSTFINPATRRLMGEQAVALAKKVQYVTAGTVEMMVDGVVKPGKETRDFYFLEMNTRLQVEHPITEMITGVDIVEEMIRVSAGLPLSKKQSDIGINGWATEARVYAEDPTKNYFPSIGRLTNYIEPEGEGVRVDTGILDGSQISVYYDPLIAKLCTWGKDRNESLARMRRALDEYVIRGLNHNVCLLRDVVACDKYISGDFTTNYLVEEYPEGFKQAELSELESVRLVASAAAMYAERESIYDKVRDSNARAGSGLVPHEEARTQSLHVSLEHNKYFALRISQVAAEQLTHRSFKMEVVTPQGTTYEGSLHLDWTCDSPRAYVQTTGFGSEGRIEDVVQFFGTNEVTYKLQFKGSVFPVNVMSPRQAELYAHMNFEKDTSSTKFLTSPMPGVVINFAVQVGQKVTAGADLLTLEAMKMRNKLKAERDCVVKKILAKEGTPVEDGAKLIEFE